jgi:hypothetical protein
VSRHPSRGGTLVEFAFAWPLVLLSVLATVELSLWASESFAARSAALAGARAGSGAGGGPEVSAEVAIESLRPSLAGTRVAGWCPGDVRRPPPVWVCAQDAGTRIEVEIGGNVPAVVPLLPARAGLPLHARASVPKEMFT